MIKTVYKRRRGDLKHFMKKKFRNQAVFFIIAIFMPFSGCNEAIIGAVSAGTGVYTYLKGEVKRSYYIRFDKCIESTNEVLNELNVNIMKPSYETAKVILKAKRINGSIIIITLIKIKPTLTEISIRSGIIGVWDKKLSELIHESIVEKLQ